MFQKKYQKWILALSYVGLIYSTIGVIRYFTQFLRSHNCLRLTIRGIYAIGFILLLRRYVRQNIFSLWKYAFLVGIFIFYFRFGKYFGTPEEEIHFIEYGLVGILFARALEDHVTNQLFLSIFALIFATITGAIDELLQKLYPSRVFDIKDIFINAFSALLGLILLNISTNNSADRIDLASQNNITSKTPR